MVFILNNGFQLAGKYKVEAKASASCKKNTESQLEVYGSCVMGLGMYAHPPPLLHPHPPSKKNGVLVVYIAIP